MKYELELFIEKQKIIAKQHDLLDNFLSLSLSFDFDRANQVKEQLNKLDRDIYYIHEELEKIDDKRRLLDRSDDGVEEELTEDDLPF